MDGVGYGFPCFGFLVILTQMVSLGQSLILPELGTPENITALNRLRIEDLVYLRLVIFREAPIQV